MPNEIESPSELNVHARPSGVTRFNRLPVLIGGGFVVAFLVAVLVGLQTRTPGGSDAANEAAGVNPKLRPETLSREEVLKNAPTGIIVAPKPEELKPPALAEAPKPPADLPDLSRTPPLVPRQPPFARLPEPTPAPAPGLSSEEEITRRVLEAMQKSESSAMNAGTTFGREGGIAPLAQGGAPAAPGGLPPQPQALAQQLARALGGAQQPQTTGGGFPSNITLSQPGGGGAEDPDPNKQERKERFLQNAQAQPESNYVRSTRVGQLGEYEIKAGWLIPAVMEHGINSDLPGQLAARVSQNVYDTATGKHLLIPQGTRLIGEYDSQVAFGQEGLLVVWKRLIYPDGSSQNLGGMGGYDEGGYSGFRDRVNHHYGRIFGWGLLTSLFGAALQLSQPANTVNPNTGLATPTNQQIIASSVGAEVARLGTQIARKNLNIQPTIEIRPGYRFFVRVEKDLLLARPYAHGNTQ